MLVTVEGRMGSGKTLTTTMIGLDAYMAGRKVLSNYHLNFPHKRFGPETFYRLNERNFDLRNCIVLADEGYLIMDRRNSMTKLNRLVNYWIVQTRKSHVDLVIATHTFERLDTRVTHAVNMRISCKFHKGVPQILVDKKGQPIPDWNKGGKPRQARNNQGDPLWIKKPVLKLVIRNRDEGTLKVKNFDPSPVFKWYDTDEIVNIPGQLVRPAA